jgi:class 3 adenylate cyclase/pimeloyl-ACP methyl ester carboxylesterase
VSDAPRVQFTKTADGVSIAYAEAGEGQTVVRVPPVPWSHVQMEWERFSSFLVTRPLAPHYRTVWYDSRGSGLSDRDSIEFSVDALVRDLEAVVDRLDTSPMVLCAIWDGVPIAVQYAAQHPDRVSHLVLIEGYTKGSDYLDSPAGDMELGIREKDWRLYTETLARLIWGFESPEFCRQAAEHFRACCEPETLHSAYNAVNQEWDITDMAPLVSAKTIVLNNRNLPWLPARAGQRLAAMVPNATFSTIDDLQYVTVPEMIGRFLTGAPAKSQPIDVIPVQTSSGMAVVLFADIADSTGLTERLGDTAFRDKARSLDGALRSVITDAGGTTVEGKLLGDGVLAIFSSAARGVEAALACATTGDREGLPLHLGLHAGDVIHEDGNVFGGAVNIAARVSALSAPGRVLVSATVRDLARTSAGVTFEDKGEQEMKGVAEPVRVYEVRWRADP